MEWDLIIIAKWLILGLSGTTIGSAAAWLRARERAIRAEERMHAWLGNPADRLDRIEQAVAAVGIEVERLGEAQRHAARLSGASTDDASSVSDPGRRHRIGRVITPH